MTPSPAAWDPQPGMTASPLAEPGLAPNPKLEGFRASPPLPPPRTHPPGRPPAPLPSPPFSSGSSPQALLLAPTRILPALNLWGEGDLAEVTPWGLVAKSSQWCCWWLCEGPPVDPPPVLARVAELSAFQRCREGQHRSLQGGVSLREGARWGPSPAA